MVYRSKQRSQNNVNSPCFVSCSALKTFFFHLERLALNSSRLCKRSHKPSMLQPRPLGTPSKKRYISNINVNLVQSIRYDFPKGFLIIIVNVAIKRDKRVRKDLWIGNLNVYYICKTLLNKKNY